MVVFPLSLVVHLCVSICVKVLSVPRLKICSVKSVSHASLSLETRACLTIIKRRQSEACGQADRQWVVAVFYFLDCSELNHFKIVDFQCGEGRTLKFFDRSRSVGEGGSTLAIDRSNIEW